MRTRIVAVGALGFALFMANEFTRTIPVYVAAGLWGMTVVYLVGCWKLAGVLRPADAPPALAGPALAKGRWLAATIGTTRGALLVGVTAYADRLVVGTPLTGSRTIMADELGPISAHGRDVRVEHRAPGLASPVTLRLRENHPLRQAIGSFVKR